MTLAKTNHVAVPQLYRDDPSKNYPIDYAAESHSRPVEFVSCPIAELCKAGPHCHQCH